MWHPLCAEITYNPKIYEQYARNVFDNNTKLYPKESFLEPNLSVVDALD